MSNLTDIDVTTDFQIKMNLSVHVGFVLTKGVFCSLSVWGSSHTLLLTTSFGLLAPDLCCNSWNCLTLVFNEKLLD